MSLEYDLTRFLESRIKESNVEYAGVFEKQTTLISSNLISSLSLLELAVWIEKHMAIPIDLKTIDPVKEWDTVERILSFIERHSAK